MRACVSIPELNLGHLQKSPGSFHLLFLVMLVTHVNDLTDATLDDELGTLVAGKQCYIHATALHVKRVLVQDGIQLCMTNYQTKFVKSSETQE